MSLLGKEWYGEFIAHKDGFREGVEEGFKIGYETAKKEFAERKTGKWVHLPNVWGVVFCSECNYALRINDTKYCPNCGAKMEVDECGE